MPQIGDTTKLGAIFYRDDTGAPYAGTATPTMTVINPSGSAVVNGGTMTQLGASVVWEYSYTWAVNGPHRFYAHTTDGDAANNGYTDPLEVVIGEAVTVEAFDGAAETQVDAIQAKTDLIGTAGALTVAAVDDSGTLTLIKGKDYKSGRAPAWERTISYTGRTISAARLNVAGLALTGSAVESGGDVTVTVEIDADDFAAIGVGVYAYEIELDLTGGASTETVQFTSGTCNLTANV